MGIIVVAMLSFATHKGSEEQLFSAETAAPFTGFLYDYSFTPFCAFIVSSKLPSYPFWKKYMLMTSLFSPAIPTTYAVPLDNWHKTGTPKPGLSDGMTLLLLIETWFGSKAATDCS
ncbi:hypothetical protein [Paenibacillus piri]|uniref:Uncharacterized protein n=1 Tax=Paenibacillus piri TaxID=2547395 RepID=A0A4R5K7Z0_9BACL|nr:hypothetical protein [Paenibacillus piri]TDF91026.1 hypothetical protein E1757_33545 [Paenibacillus piri]